MEWLTLFIYILIIFFNIFFDKFIPYANYTDELICLLFMAIAIVYICKDKTTDYFKTLFKYCPV